MSFDRMAAAIDDLAQNIEEEVYVQTGNTRYKFKYARTVKFLKHDEMLEAMNKASMVILQGGWGTISEALMLGKKIVSIPRRVGQECNHDQAELVRELERRGHLLGVYDTRDLGAVLERARTHPFVPLERGRASHIISRTIDSWFY